MTHLITAVLSALVLCSCFPVTPPLPQPLEKPVLRFDGMAPVSDPLSGHRESVHLAWNAPDGGATAIRSYTLFRRIPPDSMFDIFTNSRLIPADTTDFYDDLSGHPFPAGGFDSVFYRICAVDSFARTGDTSEIVPVILAPQAILTGYDTAHACLQWDSWIRSGVSSWCTVWNDVQSLTFTSPPDEQFPFTDQPARFTACFADSLIQGIHGRWYFALYVRVHESYSLKVGSIDAP